MLSEGAAMPDESVGFCLQRKGKNEHRIQHGLHGSHAEDAG